MIQDVEVRKAQHRARLIYGSLPPKDCAFRRACGKPCDAPGRPLYRSPNSFTPCQARTSGDVNDCVRDLASQGINVAK